MLDRFLLTTVLVLAVVAASTALAAEEEPSAPPAVGLTQGLLVCDPTEEGLKVALGETWSRGPGGFSVLQGETCLPILAGLHQRLTQNAPLHADGANAAVGDRLVWVVAAPNGAPRAIVGCDLVGGEDENVLVTAFVDALPETPYELAKAELCAETLAALHDQGLGKPTGPVVAPLGLAGEGGLLWAQTGRARGFGFVEHDGGYAGVLVCGLDADGKLVRTYFEDSLGRLESGASDESCVVALRGFGTFSVKHKPSPVAVPQPESTDPGCLIWPIDGGTRLDSGGGGGGGGCKLQCCACVPICECDLCCE
jgi:hypothetical protein